MVPVAKDTSFTDLTVTFEVWILFGILIITNSKSAKDSAFKCFIFFLISQPLIYLVQDVVNHSKLFLTYYKNWIPLTIATDSYTLLQNQKERRLRLKKKQRLKPIRLKKHL